MIERVTLLEMTRLVTGQFVQNISTDYSPSSMRDSFDKRYSERRIGEVLTIMCNIGLVERVLYSTYRWIGVTILMPPVLQHQLWKMNITTVHGMSRLIVFLLQSFATFKPLLNAELHTHINKWLILYSEKRKKQISRGIYSILAVLQGIGCVERDGKKWKWIQ